MNVEDYNWNTEEPKETKGEYARWSCRSEVLSWKLPKNDFSVFSRSLEEIGTARSEMRIYIYLLEEDSEKRICFWNGVLSDFMEADAKWKWIQLKPDHTYGEVENDHEAGMISVKMSIAKVTNQGAIAF